ncbi:MAG: lysoplasmalogenase [Polaribacter sp.]
MISKTRIYAATILFLLTSGLHIFGLFYSFSLANYTKPFLIPTLGFLYFVSSKKLNFWVIGALVFSYLGDILLLDKAQYFVFGLASFLVAHLLYIKVTANEIQKVIWKEILLVSIPFVLFLFGLLQLLFPNLNEMKIPVVVYGVVISSFGASTLMVYRQEKSTEHLWLLLGALLFILSDSLIAINTFYSANEMYPFLIMTTYILAQYLIVKSFIVKSFR